MKTIRERQFLDEAFLNGRKINKSKMLPLLEVEGGLSQLEKLKKNRDIPVFITGILQTGDEVNRNNRIYPFEYLKREFIRYMDEFVSTGLSYMELDHPESSTVPSLDRACATIDDIWFKGKQVWGRIRVLNAYMPDSALGLKVRGFILNGKSVGTSSRALGSVEEDFHGHDVVLDDLEFVCSDIVSNASNFGSEVFNLTENKQGLFLPNSNKKILTESTCFNGICGLDKKVVKDLTLQRLTESEKAMLSVLGVEQFLRTKSLHTNSKI